MVDMGKRIKDHFQESIQTKMMALDILAEPIGLAGQMMADCVHQEHKILACGNGGSSCDALHFVGELVGRLERERISLPAIALVDNVATLTSIANDYHFDEIFAKQVQGLGNSGDVLLAISTSGNSMNVMKAIEAAHRKNMLVVALTGKQGGNISGILSDGDVEIRVPSNRTMRIQETHLLVIHILCDFIDEILFGSSSTIKG